MLPIRRCYIGGGTVSSAVICKEATGNHCGVHCDMTNLRVLYWGGAGDRVQSDPEVVGAGPNPGGGKCSLIRGGG